MCLGGDGELCLGSYIHRCLVSFTIGKHYNDEIWCEVVLMDACHLLLKRTWQYDRKVIYDSFKNIYIPRG